MRKYAKLIGGVLAEDTKIMVGGVNVCDLIPISEIDLRLAVGEI